MALSISARLQIEQATDTPIAPNLPNIH